MARRRAGVLRRRLAGAAVRRGYSCAARTSRAGARHRPRQTLAAAPWCPAAGLRCHVCRCRTRA
eukprot:7407398-Lingulodinium_polyedra.AAC.1